MPKITISDLTARYKVKGSDEVLALDKVCAEFLSDSFNVIVGYSGGGKTTLLKCIAGVIDYDGEVLFDGVDVGGLAPSKRNISYVSQEYVLYPHLTVFDNIAFPLKNMGASKKEITERVKSIAEILELTHCLTRRPKHLSGGQQQRVALARALVKNPEICLFDEPLSNTDPQLRYRERRFIKDAIKRYGCTAIYVTHDFPEAMALADSLTVISDGKCVLQGEPMQVYDSGNEIVESLKGGALLI